jgi:hypothetical protein
MRKTFLALLLSFVGAGLWAQAAHAVSIDEPENYRLESASVGLSTTQAGGHPDFTTTFALSEKAGAPYGLTRDVIVRLPAGLFGNPEAFPRCTSLQLGTAPEASECPIDSQIGVTDIVLADQGTIEGEPIYNMPVPGGDIVARFGLFAGPFPTIINARLDPVTQTVVASVDGAPAAALLIASSATFWGVPASPAHDLERITPLEATQGGAPKGGRQSSLPETPFMTNPTSCGEARSVTITVRSYQLVNSPSTKTVPFPQISGCEGVEFNPSVALTPTTSQGTSGSGLDYRLQLPTKGLEFPNVNFDSELRRGEVVLPEGMTVNPSQAEGLGVCSEADLAREAYDSPPNAGCPETSKVGSVEAASPVLDRVATGSLFVAKPYENPFGSLIALYMVVKIPDRGVLVKLAGKVTTDPATGQITTVFDDVPQLPVADFKLHFREGARAPLVTPYSCGSYAAQSNLTPWSNPAAVTRPSVFAIDSGPDRGPCPTGGLPPFHPGLLAGTVNNAAGSFSPFTVQLSRTDAEQEITRFSIKLPPGLVGKLAGVPFCSDLAIVAATARKGPHGGEEELNSPSCPAASQVGTSWGGAGVGNVLTYVPGKVYLAGPYNGSPLSVVNITAAKAGPFDLGTVVVREALRVNPETAEVFVDATGSDPIPHIVQGIPVHLRDIRVFVDRPEFTLNPTDCTATSTASTLLGAGLDFASEADDNPITVSSRFQAADCAALGFEPKLKLSLKGGTKRNQVPALKAVLTARPGDANIAGTEVTLPRSAFLEQSHIRTVCTRVQFNAGAGNGAGCPAGSIYGRARAITPLLSDPLEGPVYLRSNGGERNLPDLVIALNGQQIDISLVGYIDSVTSRSKSGEAISRIRTRFVTVPDAPVSKFVLEMQGGKKGLLVNSTNLCRGKHRAEADFTAQNGRQRDIRPVVQAQCGKRKQAGGKRQARSKGHRG